MLRPRVFQKSAAQSTVLLLQVSALLVPHKLRSTLLAGYGQSDLFMDQKV